MACIVANKKIKKNEEITVDYLYAYDAGPEWYQLQYLQTYNTTEDNLESRGGWTETTIFNFYIYYICFLRKYNYF